MTARYILRTLPAFPIVSASRLRNAYEAQPSSATGPFTLLSSILAHTTSYAHEIRQHHKNLWVQALLGVEDEYRVPRLQTLQLALTILLSRPAINTGQSTISMARAVGAAQLLGLNMDPTAWSLPKWEISLRKRLFWGLVIVDKWRALLHGRPSKCVGTFDRTC